VLEGLVWIAYVVPCLALYLRPVKAQQPVAATAPAVS
jgi:hypothetical protein